jgi:hypothetical protein
MACGIKFFSGIYERESTVMYMPFTSMPGKTSRWMMAAWEKAYNE